MFKSKNKLYEIKIKCKNCRKSFKNKIPFGIDVKEANLPYGLYLYDGHDYRDIKGKKTNCTVYLLCPNCGSRRLVKDGGKSWRERLRR